MIKQTIGAFVVKGGGGIVALLASVLLARFLGPAELGTYAIAMGVVQVLTIFACLGLPQLLIRDVAAGVSFSRWSELRGLLRCSWQVTLACSLTVSTGLLVIGHVVGISALSGAVLGWAVVVLPLLAMFIRNISVLRGLGWIVPGHALEFIARPVFFVAVLIGASFWGFLIESAETALMLQGLACICSLVLSWTLLRRALPADVFSTPPSNSSKFWLGSSLVLMLYTGISTLNNQLSILIFGWFDLPGNSGLYLVASRGSEIVLFGLLAVSSTVAPKLASLYAQGDHDNLQALITRSSRQLTLYSILVASVLILAADPLVHYAFGDKYHGAVIPFRILCLAQMLNGVFGYAGLTLNMIGQEIVAMRCMLVGFTTNFCLNLVLIPMWGVSGAALANAFGIVAWKLLAAMVLDRRFKLQSGPFLLRKRGI